MLINITVDPIILQLGPVQLGWHGVLSSLALVVAIGFGLRRAEQLGLPLDTIARGVTWAIVGGFVGARLFHVLDHLSYFLANPREAFAIWQGGMAVYGGFVGGILTAIVLAQRWRVAVWPVLDAVAPAMLLGQAIGRVGCLINGDAWGAPTGAPIGVVYWHPRAALPTDLIGVPTHPYPLYELGLDLALLAGLILVGRRLPAGATFLLTTIGYAGIRFGLTTFRQETVLLWGLQEAQLVALVTGLVAASILPLRLRAGTPTTPEP